MELPKEGDWATLTSWGFEILGDAKDELGLLYKVKAPEGWSIDPEGLARHSRLLDPRGHKRASISIIRKPWDPHARITVLAQRFYAVRGSQNIKDGIHYSVLDAYLDRTVKHFEGGYYAVKKNSGEAGFLLKGMFYWEAVERNWAASTPARFSRVMVAGDAIRVISNDDFYRTYHSQYESIGLIEAAENYAKAEAARFVDSLPKDNSQWTEEFDFEAV